MNKHFLWPVCLITMTAVATLLLLDSHWHFSSLTNKKNPAHRSGTTFNLEVSELLGEDGVSGFEKVLESREFTFPLDHGPHPDFRNEWWYITGNLFDEQLNRYGFQLTFFRRKLTPNNNRQGWQNNTISMAHFAISDHKNGTFIAREKFGRDGAKAAGAQSKPFRVWLDDWHIQSKDQYNNEHNNSIFPLQLQARDASLELALTLSPEKPITIQGDNGLSQKGEHPGNASYYYSFTRLNAVGTLHYQQQRYSVTGLSWMDREWGTSALSQQQQGWDWFALQLANGDDVMFYRIRHHDGTVSRFSKGVVVTASGDTFRLTSQHVTLTPLQYWESPYNQRFPVQWKVQINHTNYRAHWIIQTPISNQFLNLSVRYWEGAVDVIDHNSRQALGYGFLEMAGYPQTR